MSKVEGTKSVIAHLQARVKKANGDPQSVIVGYTQNYALPVHENPTAHHKEGKQAKYLEGPARNLQPELAKIVEETYKKTGSVGQGLLLAGLRLQRESQEVVPIDTAALKNSAFTAYEKDYKEAAEVAYYKSQSFKAKVLKQRAKAAAKKRKK